MCDDETVQRTNDDASTCKQSAVALGYWNDPYLSAFVPRSLPSNEPRKAPEIHLGYFTRVSAIWNLLIRTVDHICEVTGAKTKMQVVNLGAGFDTLFWRLLDHLDQSSRSHILNSFVDVDLLEVSAKKCMAVRKSKLLIAKVAGDGNEEVRFSRTDLHGSKYHVVAANFTDLNTLEKKLNECGGFDYNLPTIFISECVLVYIEPTKTTSFLQWAATKFHSSVGLINHEQLNIFDKFGQVMMDNLSQRGCSLPGIEACRDKNSHVHRLVSAGWHNAVCWTMNEIYGLLPRNEVERAERIEFLDERELVNQLFEHYCVSFGWKSGPDINLDDVDFW